MSDGYLIVRTDVDTTDFDAEIEYIKSQMDEIQRKLKKADMGYEVGDTQKMETQYEKLSRTLDKILKKQVGLNKVTKNNDWSRINEQISGVGDGLSKTVKTVGRWALGIWAVRSAYSGVRQIISSISSTDKQIGTDIDYMKFAVSSGFKPVVESLVKTMYTLLTYVNMITKAWFGLDLFSKASAKNFKDAQNSAKEMKNSLAGFDTAQVLSDNSNSAGTPSMDLSAPTDAPVPTWLQWILDNKDLVIQALGGIAAGLVAIKLGLKGIEGVGLVIFIMSVIKYIQDVINYINDPSWATAGKFIEDIGIAIVGLGLIIGGPTGFILGIAGLVILLVGIIVENWDKIWGFLCMCGDLLYKYIIKPVVDWFSFMGEQIEKKVKEPIDNIKRYVSGITDGVKTVWEGIKRILNGDVKGGLELIFKGLVNIAITAINFLIDCLNGAISPIRLLVVGVGKVVGANWTMDNVKIPKFQYLKNGGIVNLPRTGVPLASDIRAGEAGPEAVLPLTEETYDNLGRKVAKYTSVSIDLINKIDRRTLNRKLIQLDEEDKFARNGG